MKTFLLSLSLFLVSTMGMTQNWAPAGATWHYDFATFWESGYVEIQYTGDTIVAGKNCKILEKTKHTYDHVEQIFINSLIGHDYTYEENNIVYYYRYGMFYILYDFASIPGDQWQIAGWEPLIACDSTGLVHVDDTSSITLNAVLLKRMKVSPDSASTWAFSSDTILERIGSLGYMFPEPTCVADLYEGGPLRCYYDDSFGLYERGSAPNCDYITGIGSIISDKEYAKVFPLPATTFVTIEISKQPKGNVHIELSDLTGNRIRTAETDNTKVEIYLGDLPAGIYFISVRDQGDLVWTRKIIKLDN